MKNEVESLFFEGEGFPFPEGRSDRSRRDKVVEEMELLKKDGNGITEKHIPD